MDGAGVLETAEAAMAVGDVAGAREALAGVCSEPGDPVAHELLAMAAYLDDDLPLARQQLEWAFRGLRPHEPRRAALVAAELAELHTSGLGNRMAGQGWLRRAERVLEPLGRCVEQGWVALALVTCSVGDVDELDAAAAAALELALEFGDHDLEVRALADRGYVLVVQGQVDEGFALLDEAMAALSAGEVTSLAVAGKCYCSLLSACDRGGDVARAEEWTRLLEETVVGPAGGRPVVLHTHCRLAFGSVMCTAGRWDEGEAALLDALGPGGSVYRVHRADASCRLATVWLEQGRIDEAIGLLRPFDDFPRAQEPLARAHLLGGRPEVARAVAERGLQAVPGDLLAEASMRSVLVEVELARLDPGSARAHADVLHDLAAGAQSRPLRALAALAEGRVAAAAGRTDDAREALEAARAELRVGERPLLTASIALELAHVHAEAGDAAAAAIEAEAALDVGERLRARGLVDRARALLRTLGAPGRAGSRRPTEAVAALTDREQQVLDLVRQGLTNAEIGERLYISAKTAEHHVGRVLAKLGVRSRAEAAAVATAAALSGPDEGREAADRGR